MQMVQIGETGAIRRQGYTLKKEVETDPDVSQNYTL
jgi:hypothetical protein